MLTSLSQSNYCAHVTTQVLTLNNLAVLSIGLGEFTTAMQQLAEVVVTSHPHPSPLTPHYNHCLLLGKMGRTAAAAESWVGHREAEGLTVEEGRERLHDARRSLSSQYVAHTPPPVC